MSFFDPYQAYTEGTVFSGNPLNTVIALYEGALDSIRQMRNCFQTGDIAGRGKAVNKGVSILTELLVTLDHENGGEISANLQRLYNYIQCKILEAHAQRTEKPLFEAEKLLGTMLEGWRGAADKLDAESRASHMGTAYGNNAAEEVGVGYGFFNCEPAIAGGVSATF